MPSPSLTPGLDRAPPAARAILSGLRHRGELAALETAEARDHLLRSLLLGAAGLIAAQLAALGLMFALAAAVWHREDRGWLLGAFALGQLVLAAALVRSLVRRLRRWEPLAETRRQLRADGECIEDLLPAENSGVR